MLEAKYQQDDCISCLPHSKAIYQNIFEDKDGGEDDPDDAATWREEAQCLYHEPTAAAVYRQPP